MEYQSAIHPKPGRERDFLKEIHKLVLDGYLTKGEALPCLKQRSIPSDLYTKVMIRIEAAPHKKHRLESRLGMLKELLNRYDLSKN